MPHEHLSLQSLHGLQSNTDHDDDGSTADGQVPDTIHQIAGHDGQASDHSQVDRTEDDDLVDNLLDEFSSGPTRAEARDEATVVLQVVGDLHGIILDGGVEPAEEEDHQHIESEVSPAVGAEQILVRPALSAVGNEGTDGGRNGADGLCEDHGHNTGLFNCNSKH